MKQSSNIIKLTYTLKTISPIARNFYRKLKKGDTVLLCGNLGVGKTTFVKYLISTMGVCIHDVTSPTFNLVNIYNTSVMKIWHFDLYRTNNQFELINIGLFETRDQGVTIIEWGDIGQKLLPRYSFKLNLYFCGHEGGRIITIKKNI